MAHDVQIIDNFSLGVMTQAQVTRAFRLRLDDAHARTAPFRGAAPSAQHLHPNWPAVLFTNPHIPIGLYFVPDDGGGIVGFLEAKLLYRDYCIVRECILLDGANRHTLLQKEACVRDIFAQLTRDCAETQKCQRIIVPRAKSQWSPNGANLNFGPLFLEDGRSAWAPFYVEIVRQIATTYRFLHLETPFHSLFIEVKPERMADVPRWFQACIDPFPLNRIDRLRVHHPSLWRVNDAPRGRAAHWRGLRPLEVDALITWQRQAGQHVRQLPLELDQDELPRRVLGQNVQYRWFTEDEPLDPVTQARLMRDRNAWELGGVPLNDIQWGLVRDWQDRRFVADFFGNMVVQPVYVNVPLPNGQEAEVSYLLELAPNGVPAYIYGQVGPRRYRLALRHVIPEDFETFERLPLAVRVRALERNRWRINNERPPTNEEYAILLSWQNRSYTGPRAAQNTIDRGIVVNDRGLPTSLFGLQLMAKPEDVRRLQLIAYKDIVHVPHDVRRIETKNWWEEAQGEPLRRQAAPPLPPQPQQQQPVAAPPLPPQSALLAAQAAALAQQNRSPLAPGSVAVAQPTPGQSPFFEEPEEEEEEIFSFSDESAFEPASFEERRSNNDVDESVFHLP